MFQIKKGLQKNMVTKQRFRQVFELWTFGTEFPELLFEHFSSTAYPKKLRAVSW